MNKNQHSCDNTCIKSIVFRCVLELSDKICISFTNADIICYWIHNFAWTYYTTAGLAFERVGMLLIQMPLEACIFFFSIPSHSSQLGKAPFKWNSACHSSRVIGA